MSGDLPERDPLADLVSRSVGARVDRVEVEMLSERGRLERKRLRFHTSAGASSAIFERRARGQTLEAQLLPFLARKTDRVPVVHSRGLPPPSATLGPWLLIEDVYGGPSACERDAGDIVRAKLAIEHAVANDLPALRALGVRDDPRDVPALRGSSRVLLHGALLCDNALRVERGVVIVDWSHAAIGAAVWDIAALARELVAHGRDEAADAVRTTYVREAGGDAETALDVALSELGALN